MLGRHMRLKVCHGGALSFFITGPPFSEEADGQTAEHSQNPNTVAVANTAVVFVG